jgi:hypothetical protein
MAQAPRQTGGEGAADFIRHVVTDPKNVPDVTLLRGYLGASSEDDHERLYLSPDLANYVEIPKAAILHQAPLPTEQDAHGGVTLWVKKDAALQYKMAPAAQALANYFAGAIQAGAQGAAPVAPQPPLPHTGGIDCSVICPTRFGPCQSHHFTCAPCVTLHPLQCTIGYTQPPHCILETVGPPCLTRNVVQCSFVCTQPGQCLQSVGAPCVTQHPVQCSIACLTQFVTCGAACQITHNPALCPVASGGIGCGGFPGQPGFGGQVAQMRAYSFAECTEANCGLYTNRCPITQRTPCWM